MTDYYGVFGLERPEPPTGANEPEPAAPAIGGNELEGDSQNADGLSPHAEPATINEEADSAGGEVSDDAAENSGEMNTAAENDKEQPEAGQLEPGQDAAQSKEQSKEERARNAAKRRERERRELAEQIREEERQRLAQGQDALIASMGMTNPYSGELIASKADLEHYQQQVQEERNNELERQLRKSGLERKTIEDVVANNPLVRQALSKAEEAVLQSEAERAEVARQRQTEADLAEINKLDPAIKKLEDFRDKPYISQLTGMLRSGYALIDAYKLVTEEERWQSKLAQAKQAALNSIGSKEHHQPTTTRAGQGLLTPPPEVERYYRTLMPDATTEEIRKHYTANVRAQ